MAKSGAGGDIDRFGRDGGYSSTRHSGLAQEMRLRARGGFCLWAEFAQWSLANYRAEVGYREICRQSVDCTRLYMQALASPHIARRSTRLFILSSVHRAGTSPQD
jgi:hypothetical protein